MNNNEKYVSRLNDIVECYSFMDIKLFNEVLTNGEVIPKNGIHCSLSNTGAYYALERRHGARFFGWQHDFWTGNKHYPDIAVNGDDSDTVLVKMKVPKKYLLFTNFRNWTDMDYIYMHGKEDPTDKQLKDILDIAFSGLERTLEQLWEDVFYIDDEENVQILFSKFSKDWIVSHEFVNYSIISY